MVKKIYTALFDYQLEFLPSAAQIEEHVLGPLCKALKASFQMEERSGCENTSAENAYDFSGDGYFAHLRLYRRDSPQECDLMTLLIESKKPIDLDDDGLELGNLQHELSNRMVTDERNFRSLGCLKRCLKDSPYFKASDHRILEYPIKEVLFSQRSPFQHVQIVDTNDFGKLLILDDMPNLAENDTKTYTHNLMALPMGLGPKYKDANILILGGGDGALLKEIFAQPNKPAMVTMVEIDDIVMDAVNLHMPSVAGPYLRKDYREGPNHKIIVGDAIEFMKNELDKGTQYDIIFGDLTDCPISTSPSEEGTWNFLKLVLSLAIPLLKPEQGYYLTHCNGINATRALREYEKHLKTMHNGKCTFTSSKEFVSSFMETWVYYQIQRHN
uniref:Spermine synthase n=1 Tax=Caligus clemensi TaxID=344056 RepID=C1C0U1_CALCM|nr:Spermine synthase [Caligus clemensi]